MAQALETTEAPTMGAVLTLFAFVLLLILIFSFLFALFDYFLIFLELVRSQEFPNLFLGTRQNLFNLRSALPAHLSYFGMGLLHYGAQSLQLACIKVKLSIQPADNEFPHCPRLTFHNAFHSMLVDFMSKKGACQ